MGSDLLVEVHDHHNYERSLLLSHDNIVHLSFPTRA
jgi:hypothetical protein